MNIFKTDTTDNGILNECISFDDKVYIRCSTDNYYGMGPKVWWLLVNNYSVQKYIPQTENIAKDLEKLFKRSLKLKRIS